MSALFATAEDAEEAFYEAIGRGDLEALMSIWADDDEIVCIHPTGQRLTGPAAIAESWRIIFANNPRLAVRVTPCVRWKGVMLDVHSVVETLYLGDEATAHGPMLATNVYQRGPDGWRLLSRHSSAALDDGSIESTDERLASRTHTLH